MASASVLLVRRVSDAHRKTGLRPLIAISTPSAPCPHLPFVSAWSTDLVVTERRPRCEQAESIKLVPLRSHVQLAGRDVGPTPQLFVWVGPNCRESVRT